MELVSQKIARSVANKKDEIRFQSSEIHTSVCIHGEIRNTGSLHFAKLQCKGYQNLGAFELIPLQTAVNECFLHFIGMINML